MFDFFSYIKSPEAIDEYSKWKNIYLIYFFFILFIFGGLGNGIGLIFTNIFNISSKINNIKLGELILPALIIAPIGEELLFRLLLKQGKMNLKIFFASGICLFTIYALIGFSNSSFILSSLLISVFIIYIILKNKCIDIYSKTNYKYLFWGSAIIFGLSHSINFTYPTIFHLFIAPLIILPQLVMGLIFGFIRVKFGLKYAIGLHFLTNVLFLISRIRGYS